MEVLFFDSVSRCCKGSLELSSSENYKELFVVCPRTHLNTNSRNTHAQKHTRTHTCIYMHTLTHNSTHPLTESGCELGSEQFADSGHRG